MTPRHPTFITLDQIKGAVRNKGNITRESTLQKQNTSAAGALAGWAFEGATLNGAQNACGALAEPSIKRTARGSWIAPNPTLVNSSRAALHSTAPHGLGAHGTFLSPTPPQTSAACLGICSPLLPRRGSL